MSDTDKHVRYLLWCISQWPAWAALVQITPVQIRDQQVVLWWRHRIGLYNSWDWALLVDLEQCQSVHSALTPSAHHLHSMLTQQNAHLVLKQTDLVWSALFWSTLMNVSWLCENLICPWGEVHVEYAHVSTLFLNTFLIRKARKRWIKAWQHPKNLGYK